MRRLPLIFIALSVLLFAGSAMAALSPKDLSALNALFAKEGSSGKGVNSGMTACKTATSETAAVHCLAKQYAPLVSLLGKEIAPLSSISHRASGRCKASIAGDLAMIKKIQGIPLNSGRNIGTVTADLFKLALAETAVKLNCK